MYSQPPSVCHCTAREDRTRMLTPPIAPTHAGTRTRRHPTHLPTSAKAPQHRTTQQSLQRFCIPTPSPHVHGARTNTRTLATATHYVLARSGTRTHRPPSHQSVPVETPQHGATQQSEWVSVQPTHVQNARRSERAAVVKAQRAAASGERAGGERQRASDSNERAATERQRAASERQW